MLKNSMAVTGSIRNMGSAYSPASFSFATFQVLL